MKKNHFKKIGGGVLALLLSAAVQLQAQPRPGGGGGGGYGGFGGFGGFGGGGGLGAFNRGGGSSTGSSQYNNNGTVGSAVIQVDPTTHNLIVIADRQTAEQIQQVIESMDMPEPQVLIKVVFLEVQHNNASEIGVQGSFTGGSLGSGLGGALTGLATNSFQVFSNGTVGPSSVSPTFGSFNTGNNFGLPAAVAGATGNGGLYQVLGNDFTATLQAIAAAGKSQVLSRPSILARDGQQAQIVVGQEIYLPSGVSYITTGNSSVTVPTINGSYQNVGIILDVTPFIGANDLIQMIVQPQTSEIDSSTPGQIIAYGSSAISTAPVYAPNIDIRSANTVVITPNGQTVVIGGLISNTKSQSDSKVPFLGDIPLLGNLFKSSSKADSKTELLMFLTPHIVKAPSQLTPMSTSELNSSMLITNSISEEELDRFLERVPVKKDVPAKKSK